MSFVYDIADLYKTETSIPAAFEAVAENNGDIDRKLRILMRHKILKIDLLKRIANDIAWIFSVSLQEEMDNHWQIGNLWDNADELDGGKNYAEEDF